MQKLVTIYLDRRAYLGGKMLVGPLAGADKHCCVEEHLKEYLADGWSVKSLCAVGGETGMDGWLAVVLEKV
ncbi:MAG: hypothetical protein NTW87_07385 [Planctomycetota bacterium]|nr:hypothetical protein [Planctomycetota bacterium]